MNTHTWSTDPHTDYRRYENEPQPGSHDQSRRRLEEGDPPRGPIARIIAGSVAAGLAAAVVLAAVVFPGATEATITGSLLVAFGLGWGLLGWASTRFTQRALRWTRVPALALTATGLALLVFNPADTAMPTLGWIWSAPTVALAVHLWVQARRTVPRRRRWMRTVIAGVLAVAAVGATYENFSVVRDQHTYA